MSDSVKVDYIIQKPTELLTKFLLEAEKINGIPSRNDFFNFVVTSAILSEWIHKHYKFVVSKDFIDTFEGKSDTGLPIEAEEWIEDKTCLPNSAQGATRHILNSMRICWHTTNATKHYKWQRSKGINSIGTEAPIENMYDYFFTSVDEGLFIRYKDENYTIQQVKNILVQFYPRLIDYLESLNNSM